MKFVARIVRVSVEGGTKQCENENENRLFAHTKTLIFVVVSLFCVQGGGTLDISILHVSEGYCEVMGSDGDDRLGGADFDASVAHLLTQKHLSVLENLSAHNDAGGGGDMAELLAYSCDRITDDLPLCSVSSFHTLGEKVKISLSQQQQEQQQTDDGETTEEQQREPIVARTRCLALPAFSANERGSPSPLEPESLCESLFVEELGVALEEYNTVCEPLFDRSVVPAKRLVEDLTLRDEEIDEIVMVGGTTRMPQIRALVREAFPEAQLNTHIDPDITVVRAHVEKKKKKIRFRVACHRLLCSQRIGARNDTDENLGGRSFFWCCRARICCFCHPKPRPHFASCAFFLFQCSFFRRTGLLLLLIKSNY